MMTIKRAFYDDPVAWEFFDEIEDFKLDLRRYGFADLAHDDNDDRHIQAHWDAMVFARALAEDRNTLFQNKWDRSRGPGRRIRHRYWDELSSGRCAIPSKGVTR